MTTRTTANRATGWVKHETVGRLLVMIGLLGTCCANGSVQLVKQGETDAAIVLKADASASEQWAARDLADHIKAMSGATLPIVSESTPLPERAVILGDGPVARSLGVEVDAATLGDDGYTIKTVGQRLVIAGGQRRGTMYGVYTLLEKLGCQWWTPNENTIPKMGSVVVPELDLTEVPALEYRDFLYGEMGNTPEAQLWRARNKVNGGFWKTLPPEYGGVYTFDTLVHSYQKRLPSAKYFKKQPECFALKRGQRTGGQPCFSSDAAVRIIAESILADAAKHPEYHHFTVGQNDNHNYCECDGCLALAEQYGLSGMQLDFAHRIAKIVRKTHPDLRINVPAYTWSRQPPAGGMKPDENMSMTLCSIECDFGRPLAEGYPEVNAAFKQDIEGWSGIADKLLIWDYTTNFKHYLLPWPNYYVLTDNVRFFVDHSVVGYMAQGSHTTRNGQFAALNMWVLARSMWNPHQDGKALVREFISGYYGAAAPHIQQYADDLHAAMMQDRSPLLCRMIKATWLCEPFLSPALVTQAERSFDLAEATAADDPEIARRVRTARIPLQYLVFKRAWEMWPAVLDARPGASMEAYGRRFSAALKEAGTLVIADHDRGAANLSAWAEDYGHLMDSASDSDLPVELREADSGKVLLIQAAQFEGQMRFLVESAEASDGWAQAVISHGWAIQHRLGIRDLVPGKSYRVCVRVRATAKQPAAEDLALLCGVRSTTTGEGSARGGLEMARADGAWHVVDLGMYQGSPDGDYFWIALNTKTKANVESAEIDCLWLEQL